MYPTELVYTAEHEWARREADGSVTIGITAHAQDALGDVVYVELPKVGASLSAGETFGVVESVKSVSDLYAPCDGEVVAINETLRKDASQINSAPYGGGWICRVMPSNPGQLASLMTAEAYAAHVAAEAH
ncbi:MAG: glycine cleavage system protein GcvH [Myxococcales bacterium]|nr:glycine cleavage system protein GcvH [Myxococcales bacterium]MCB9548405.1 glycine cleavage system protein GcvH [Myxococcales bacterium]